MSWHRTWDGDDGGRYLDWLENAPDAVQDPETEERTRLDDGWPKSSDIDDWAIAQQIKLAALSGGHTVPKSPDIKPPPEPPADPMPLPHRITDTPDQVYLRLRMPREYGEQLLGAIYGIEDHGCVGGFMFLNERFLATVRWEMERQLGSEVIERILREMDHGEA